MSDIRCRAGWHDWNKYGDMTDAFNGLCQFKSCKRCNKIEWTKIYGNQARSEQINKTVKEVGE
jgi:hypothetical protein